LFEAVYSATPVIPRESGVSSTSQLHGSITIASGILDHPLSRVMTTGAGDDGGSRR
jgi:hypothetical protein